MYFQIWFSHLFAPVLLETWELMYPKVHESDHLLLLIDMIYRFYRLYDLMDLQALKLAFSYAPPRMCLKLCGISGDCRSRPVNMGDEPVNELRKFGKFMYIGPTKILNGRVTRVPRYWSHESCIEMNAATGQVFVLNITSIRFCLPKLDWYCSALYWHLFRIYLVRQLVYCLGVWRIRAIKHHAIQCGLFVDYMSGW